MKWLFRFIINSFIFFVIALYLIVFFFKKEILDESLYLLNKNISGEIFFEKGDINSLSSFPFFEIELDNLEISENSNKSLNFKKIYIDINIWSLIFREISIKNIKALNGFLDFSLGNNLLDVFKKNDNQESKFKFSFGDLYLYNSKIKKEDIDIYFKNLSYKIKQISHLKRIYVDADGNYSDYNIPFNTNTILKIKQNRVEIGGFTNIFNYRFKNLGKYDIIGEEFKNLEIALEEKIDSVSVLNYETNTFNLKKIKKGKGFFSTKISVKKEFVFGDDISVYFDFFTKDTDVNIDNKKIFAECLAQLKYSYVNINNSINKELNIYKIKTKLDGGVLDLEVFFKETNQNYNFKLFSDSYIPENISKIIFDNELKGSVKGKIDFELNKKDTTIIKSYGSLNIKLDDIYFYNQKVQINSIIKNVKIYTEKSSVNYDNQVYNLSISDIDIIPLILSKEKVVKGNLQLNKKDFSLKTELLYKKSLNNHQKLDIDNISFKSPNFNELKNISKIEIDIFDKKISTNNFLILVGNSEFAVNMEIKNEFSEIFISSKKGELNDIFTINNNFFLPKKLQKTRYTDLNIKIEKQDSNLNITNVSFFSEEINDNIIIKGNIIFSDTEKYIKKLELVFGSTDFTINRDNKYIYNISSKYVDIDIFQKKENTKKVEINFDNIDIPKDNIYIVNIKSLNYKDNIFNFVNAGISTQNKKIILEKLNMRYSGGDIKAQGEFIFSSNPFFEGKIYFNNIKLEDVSFKIGKNTYIKDNFQGSISIDSEAKIFIKNDGAFDFSRSLIKNKIFIKNGKAINYQPLMSVDKYFNESNLSNVSFSSIETTIMVYNNKILFPKTEVPSTIGHFYFSAEIDFNEESEYKIFLPYDLYQKLYLNAILKMEKSENKEQTEVKEKYQGEYKVITIMENKDEFKVII